MRKVIFYRAKFNIIVLLALSITACTPDITSNVPTTNNNDANSPVAFPQQLFITESGEALEQLQMQAKALTQASETFIIQRTLPHWEQLKQQWLISHKQWHFTVFYLQAFGIPSPLLNNIHATPVSPGYLDAIEGYPYSGIIYDQHLPINSASIREQHRRFSDEEVALGIHALEFFIWGREISHYTDEREIKQAQTINGLKQQQLPTPRRAAYLKLLTSLWQQDIEKLQHFWKKNNHTLKTLNFNVFLSQRIGALAENKHCQFSHDLSWQLAVLKAAQAFVNTSEQLTPLISYIESQASPITPLTDSQQKELNHLIGKAMINIQPSDQTQQKNKALIKKPAAPVQK